MPRALALAAALALTSCANLAQKIPHAKFEIGGFGVNLSVDTRPALDPLANLVESGTQAVGITKPEAAPAVPPAAATPK